MLFITHELVFLQYVCEVKQRAAFIYFSTGAFSQAEVLFLESGCDPREVAIYNFYRCICNLADNNYPGYRAL